MNLDEAIKKDMIEEMTHNKVEQKRIHVVDHINLR